MNTSQRLCFTITIVYILAACATDLESVSTTVRDAKPLSGLEHPIMVDTRAFEPGVPGGRLAVWMGDDGPATFNPVTSFWNKTETAVNRMLYSSPIEWDPITGIWTAKLAGNFIHRDRGRILEITLRDGLSWSDGVPLTIDDIIYSYEAVYLRPSNPGLTDEAIANLGGVIIERIGSRSYSLTVGRLHPDIWWIASLIPIPRHVFEPVIEAGTLDLLYDFWTPSGGVGNHVGSGPFVLLEQEQDSFVRLGRNPHYYERDADGLRLPYLDEVVMVFSSDDEEGLYRDKTVDVAEISSPVGGVNVGEIRIDESHYISRTSYLGASHFLMFNQSMPNEESSYGHSSPAAGWLRNDDFLLALAHLIDRAALNDAVHGGEGIELWTWARPQAPVWFDASGLLPESNAAKAKKILTDLGWVDTDGDGVREDGDGNPLRFTLRTNDDNAVRAILIAALADQMSLAGIEIVPETLPWDDVVLSRLVDTGDWEAMVLGVGWSLDHNYADDIEDWDGAWPRRNDNRPYPPTDILDRVSRRLEVTIDQEESITLYRMGLVVRALQNELMWLLQDPTYYAMRLPYHNWIPRSGDGQMISFERVFIPGEYQ